MTCTDWPLLESQLKYIDLMLTKGRLYPIPTPSWPLEIEDVPSMARWSSIWAHHGAHSWCNYGSVNIEMGKTKTVHGLGLRDGQRWPAVAWMDRGNHRPFYYG